MRRIIWYELRKIWYKRWIMIVLSVLFVFAAWIIVTGAKPLSYVTKGYAKKMNEETKPYWGQYITEEIKEIATEKALSYGAEKVEYAFSDDYSLDTSPIISQYGESSVEAKVGIMWCQIASQPVYEQEKQEYLNMIEQIETQYQEGEIETGYYRSLVRGRNGASWQIAPSLSAWYYWLDSMDFSSVLSGLMVIALLLVFLGDLFSKEESGGLGEISLATKNYRKWVASKMIAAAITGFSVAFILYSAVLLIFGILFGFQGYNVGILSLVSRGYTYGTLYREINALQYGAIRLLAVSLAGAYFGMLIAALSSLLRNQMLVAVSFLLICVLMESLLFIECNYRAKMGVSNVSTDWVALQSALVTPVRAFCNIEQFTIRNRLMSDNSKELFINTLIYPSFAILYYGFMGLGTLLNMGICMQYKRPR